MHPLIEAKRQDLRLLVTRYGLHSLRVFGSMARDDFHDESDVDLLVSPGRPLSGFELGALLMDAQELLNRKVDMVTVNGLHPMMRERVLSEAVEV